jgi:hypothetical protein
MAKGRVSPVVGLPRLVRFKAVAVVHIYLVFFEGYRKRIDGCAEEDVVCAYYSSSKDHPRQSSLVLA